jgi:hypothetical protein
MKGYGELGNRTHFGAVRLKGCPPAPQKTTIYSPANLILKLFWKTFEVLPPPQIIKNPQPDKKNAYQSENQKHIYHNPLLCLVYDLDFFKDFHLLLIFQDFVHQADGIIASGDLRYGFQLLDFLRPIQFNQLFPVDHFLAFMSPVTVFALRMAVQFIEPR